MLEFCRAALGRVPAIGDGMKYEYFSKTILKDKSLADATKIVANYLIHLAGWENDNILPSMNTLSDLVSVNKAQVVAAIKQLKEKEYIRVAEDNTFTFYINGIKFEKQDLSNPDVCHMFGDFVKAPMDLLCNDLAKPSTRIAAIMFFEWNFDINKYGNYEVKRKKVQIDAVAKYYGIEKDAFEKRIQNAKKAGLIDYKTIKTGKEETLIINAKVHKLVRVWINVETLAAKKSIKLAEEAKKETIAEEEKQEEPTITYEVGRYGVVIQNIDYHDGQGIITSTIFDKNEPSYLKWLEEQNSQVK